MSVKTVVDEIYTHSAVMGFTHKPRQNLPADMGTISGRVSMLCLRVHMQKRKTICVYTQLWEKQNSYVSRYPVLCLRNIPYKSLTSQS